MKKRSKIHLVSFLIIALILGIHTFSRASVAQTSLINFNNGPVYRANAEGIALVCVITWNSSSVDEIIQTAEDTGEGITFFVNTRWAQEHPDSITRILNNDKNAIGLLGYAQNQKEFLEELKTAKTLNISSELYMPADDDDAQKMSKIVGKQGMKLVIASFDVQNKSTARDQIVARIVNNSFDGALIRFEPTQTVAAALKPAITQLQLRGRTSFSLEEYLAGKNEI